MKVNTLHYSPQTTEAILRYFLAGPCDAVNIFAAALEGYSGLRFYLDEFVDDVVDAQRTPVGMALVQAGLDAVDFSALSREIIKHGRAAFLARCDAIRLTGNAR